jgi:voltage-gated potassium channel Kch
MAAPETLSAEQVAAPETLGAGSRHELKNVSYECFILALSITSLVNIVLGYLVRQPEVGLVLTVMDVILSFIFLGDFTYRLFTAPTRRGYFVGQQGWLDLLSSLPLPQVKIFRLFRVVRVVRLLRAVGPRRFFDAVLRDRASSALLVVIFLALLLLEFGSALILAIEIRAPDGNIKDASDALWYTYVTVTTVGYGDRYPVTNAGRLVGVLIMTVGVGLFGTLTGFLANAFVSPSKGDGKGDGSDAAESGGDAAALRAELAEVRRQLEALQPAPRAAAAATGAAPDGTPAPPDGA